MDLVSKSTKEFVESCSYFVDLVTIGKAYHRAKDYYAFDVTFVCIIVNVERRLMDKSESRVTRNFHD